ncbi:MAG: cysteine hydrolase [Firmicutes bacterium]|nr:cysteine hydrolase [Bacillota bacterium]
MHVLIVIDMQRDFVNPDGALSFPGAQKLLAPIRERIREFRAANWPVITTQDWHAPDDLEFERFPVHCVANTRGAELTAEIDDALAGYQNHSSIRKTRYSAFHDTGLQWLLAELNPELVEVVGVCTNICVLHTVEELRNRDIPTIVHTNSVDSFDQEAHKFALTHMQTILGAEVK